MSIAQQPKTSTSQASHKQHRSPDRKWWITTIAALLTSCYVLHFLFGTPPPDDPTPPEQVLGNPDVKERILSNRGSWSHILGGLVAMTIGPFQFLISFNKQPRVIHRWLGRIYMAAVAVGGVGSILLSVKSIAYPVGRWGFAILGSVWLATAAQGLSAARKQDYASHRVWMMRNFALTYAAVMLRWQLPLLVVSGFPVEKALTITAFSCWVPNVVFMEWWIGRGEKVRME